MEAITNKKAVEDALSAELYMEYSLCRDGHFDHAIACALKERRFNDAKAIKLQRGDPGYATTEFLPAEIEHRLELLITQLTCRLETLADVGDIEGCEVCHDYQGIIGKILDLKVHSLAAVSASASASASSEPPSYTSVMTPAESHSTDIGVTIASE